MLLIKNLIVLCLILLNLNAYSLSEDVQVFRDLKKYFEENKIQLTEKIALGGDDNFLKQSPYKELIVKRYCESAIEGYCSYELVDKAKKEFSEAVFGTYHGTIIYLNIQVEMKGKGREVLLKQYLKLMRKPDFIHYRDYITKRDYDIAAGPELNLCHLPKVKLDNKPIKIEKKFEGLIWKTKFGDLFVNAEPNYDLFNKTYVLGDCEKSFTEFIFIRFIPDKVFQEIMEHI